MSFFSTSGLGRSTSFFTSVAASDVHVPGLNSGAAGAKIGTDSAYILSSTNGLYTISPDIAALLAAGPFIASPSPPESESIFSALDAGLQRAA